MMKKQIIVVLALVAMQAACSQAAQTNQPAPSLPPGVSLTPIQSPSPTSTPLTSPILTLKPSQTLEPPSEPVLIPSPDGRWTAILNREAGSLEVEDAQGVKHTVFPASSAASDARWSPDSLRLAVVLSNAQRPIQSPDQIGIAEIWLVTVVDSGLSEPRLVLQPGPSDEFAGAWITLGTWSPQGSRLLFWPGPLSASIQADGLPLWSLEVETGQAIRLAEMTLMNPAYQSWSPDGSALVFTNGGYRSAQVNKWLSLYEVASGQIRSLIARSEFIPGAVAWSPAGDMIAFAAIRESQTGDEWADWMSWENPAILARRIYLLDPQAGEYQRLNTDEAYQDAPRWSTDGKTLYYVQIDGDQADLMGADPMSGEAQPLYGCQMPLPDRAGYYGQVDWDELYAACPALSVSSTPSTTAPLLDIFPLYPGTSWTYTYTGYSQSPSDPNEILHGTLEIRETVSDVKSYPPFTLVHILGSKSLVEADPGWQENETIGLGNYEYVYVLREGNVYRSDVYPDPANIQTDQLLKEFRFPMAPGADWCPSELEKGYLTPPAETPVPCAYAGRRVVEMEGSYQTLAGSFDHCHQMRDLFNSGGVIQWFCDGVGVVARKYDHAGSRFGFTQELTAFSLGIQQR